ncbi:MAG: GntR family transcriptional regulator [Actinobacteria bacterium]|nr:GntR family transcriptional regulator [Actinomycetota bacterium]
MSADRPFGPVERATVPEQVRDDIHRRIISGEIPPGSPLPAERVLAEQFAVARTSVREAIQGLIALGVIERRGNRSYVAERLPDAELHRPDGSKRSLREALEAHHVLERSLFEMAAARATMRERSEALALARRPAPADVGEFLIVERQFHAAIAGACDNPVLVEVYGRIMDVLMGTDEVVALVLGVAPGEDPAPAIAKAASEHLRIAEAYVDQDLTRMMEEWEHHRGPSAWRQAGRVRRPAGPTRAREAWGLERTVGS